MKKSTRKLVEVAEDSVHILEALIGEWNTTHPEEPDVIITDLRKRTIKAIDKVRKVNYKKNKLGL